MNWHWLFNYGHFCGMSVHIDKVSQYWSFPGRCHSNCHSPWPSCSVTYTSFVPFLKWRLLTLAKGNLILVWGLPPSNPKTSRNPDPQWATNRLLSSSKSMPSGPPSRSPVKRQTHDNETENEIQQHVMSTIKPTEQFDKDPQDYTTKNEVQHGINVSQN